MSYKKLKKEEIKVEIEQSKDGELVLIVGMYERDNWRCSFPVRLINFPDDCASLDDFKSFTIIGVQGQSV